MRTRANPMVIGAFAVAAVALAVAGLVVFGKGKFFTEGVTVVMHFDEDVTGLSVGSPVLMRGVKVGEVTDVQARAGARGKITVFARLEPKRITGRLPDKDFVAALTRVVEDPSLALRAQLKFLSFVTGQLAVAMDSHPGSPIRLTKLVPEYPEIPTLPTKLAELSKRLEGFVAKIEDLPLDQLFKGVGETVEGINTLVRSPDVAGAVRNARAALADAQKLIRDVDAQVAPLATSVKDTSDAARGAVQGVERDARKLLQEAEAKLTALAANVGTTSDTAREALRDSRKIMAELEGKLGPMATSLTGTSDAARTALEHARGTLAGIDAVLTQDSALGYEVAETLQQVVAAARAMRTLAELLERQPDALLWGRGRQTGVER